MAPAGRRTGRQGGDGVSPPAQAGVSGAAPAAAASAPDTCPWPKPGCQPVIQARWCAEWQGAQLMEAWRPEVAAKDHTELVQMILVRRARSLPILTSDHLAPLLRSPAALLGDQSLLVSSPAGLVRGDSNPWQLAKAAAELAIGPLTLTATREKRLLLVSGAIAMSGYSRLESPADSPGRSSNIRFQQLTHRRAADSPSRAARGGGPAHYSSEVDAGAHYTPSRSRSPHGTRPHETGSDSEPSRSGHHGLQVLGSVCGAARHQLASPQCKHIHLPTTFPPPDTLQAIVTVVLQGEGSSSGSEASGGDCGNTEAAAAPAEEGAVFMSQRELEEMIKWETNNLYDYLRGLYARGLEEAQAGHEFDK